VIFSQTHLATLVGAKKQVVVFHNVKAAESERGLFLKVGTLPQKDSKNNPGLP
jgi:hypothetical protein